MVRIFLIGMLTVYAGFILWLAIASGDVASWPWWRWAVWPFLAVLFFWCGWALRGWRHRRDMIRSGERL